VTAKRKRRRPPLDPRSLWYDMAECAIGLGESVITTKRRLMGGRRMDGGCCFKVGGRWYTSKSLLLRHLGAAGAELVATLEERRRARSPSPIARRGL